MKINNIVCACASSAVLGALGACVSGDYTAPPQTQITNHVTLNKSFDRTWDNLVTYASESFFGIENFEKDSGLLTLSFGAGDVAQFIDCGSYDISVGANNYTGPYATYLQRHHNATLTGKMNLRVAELSSGQSKVSVNARYVFSSPPYVSGTGIYATRIPGVTWVFDSLTSDTQIVANSGDRDTTSRTCQATGKAEHDILESLKAEL